jgi:hypothetical protein
MCYNYNMAMFLADHIDTLFLLAIVVIVAIVAVRK